MPRLRRTVMIAAVAASLAVAAAALAGCAAPAYTYAADGRDHAYFKVPASWDQVPARALASAQDALLKKTEAGAAGGQYIWSRAYAAVPDPGAADLLQSAPVPVVYASVQSMRVALRSGLSFDEMRNLLWPVTQSARQLAAANGVKFSGFSLLGSSTLTTADGVRGINEIFEYDFGKVLDVFDQTVLTNTATTKLYLLLVQCDQSCFAKYLPQIKAIVESFTVRGS